MFFYRQSGVLLCSSVGFPQGEPDVQQVAIVEVELTPTVETLLREHDDEDDVLTAAFAAVYAAGLEAGRHQGVSEALAAVDHFNS